MFLLVSKSRKKLKNKLKLLNYLQLDKLKKLSHEEFEQLNWLPVTSDSNNMSTQVFLIILMNNSLTLRLGFLRVAFLWGVINLTPSP